jgi:hypothetical protein
MTIDDQLRALARQVNQQEAISGEEIVQRASNQRTRSLTSRSRFTDRRNGRNNRPDQFGEDDTIVIEPQAPGPTDRHGEWNVRVVAVGLLAAVLVIAIVLVARGKDNPVRPANQPFPTVTVAPTSPAQALPFGPPQRLEPGTYFLGNFGAPSRVLITIGQGWTGSGLVLTGRGGFIAFVQPEHVYADACNFASGFQPGPLTTLDGMVAALNQQRGWVDVTAPSDASVDGYAGKTFQRTAPAGFTSCNVSRIQRIPGVFASWTCCTSHADHYSPNDIETLRILDLHGMIFVISAVLHAGYQDSAAAELAAVLNSIRIEPAAAPVIKG